MTALTRAATAAPADAAAGAAPGRLDGADLLRAVAVVGVVAVHAAHWPATDSATEATVWEDVTLAMRFSVPVFVVLTGMLLQYRHAAVPEPSGFLLRRARRSLVPWLAWAPLYCVTGLLLTNDVTHSAFGVGDWWAGGGGHLYFLLLVPQLYLLFLLWPRRLRAQLGLAALLLTLQVGLCVLRLSGAVPAGFAADLVLWHGFLLSPFWVGYFAVGVAAGGLAAAHRVRATPVVAAAALLAVVPATVLLLRVPVGTADTAAFATGTGAFLRPTLVPLVLLLCVAAFSLAPWVRGHAALRRGCRLLSRHALGIYIVQALVLYAPGRVLFPVLQRSLPWSVPGFVVQVALGLLLSLGVAALLARSPLAWSVGIERGTARPGPQLLSAPASPPRG